MKETFKSNIYVRNIPKEITEDEFKAKMGEAGKIISVRLKEMVQNIDGESYVKNKTGYVCFEKVEEAQKCIKLFDESHKFGWGGNALKVDFWQSKYDLKHETEEKNINQVKKFIKFIQQDMQDQQHKSNPQMYPMQNNMGQDRGNKFNNRSRGFQQNNQRGGGRGQGGGRGGYNKNQTNQ